MSIDTNTDGVSRYREALARIAEIASAAAGGTNRPGAEAADLGCEIKVLPDRLQERAAATARRVNPVNAPLRAPLGRLAVPDPLALTVSTTRYWGPTPRRFTVSFLDSAPADLRARILEHMNAWNAWCGMSFVQTADTGEVRIAREPDGYWSYLGTDILHVPASRQTMNLQGFTMSTPESEYHRVVRHETGHTLGFPHEHMRRELVARIDPQKAYVYFRATQGWDRRMVDAQVLTALDDDSIFGTAADQDSIMCYQLPGQITKDGQPIRGGLDINATDSAFAAQIYPLPAPPPPVAPDGTGTSDSADDSTDDGADTSVRSAASDSADDWAESEDVLVTV